MKHFYCLCFLIVSCSFINNNPLDESGDNYDPPIIIIDPISIQNNDTISRDSIILLLIGNRPQSLFQTKLNEENWSKWQPEGTFSFEKLEEGLNIIRINTMYRGGTLIFNDSLFFIVKFEIDTTEIDTTEIDTTDTTEIDTTEIDTAKEIYSITYISTNNSGGHPPEKSSYIDGTYIKVPQQNTLIKTGYSFYSWNTDSLGTGVDYTPNSSLLVDKNLTLYARWQKNSYNLEFVCVDNDYGEIPQSNLYDFEECVIIPSSNLTKTGYAFKNWNSKPDGKGQAYESGDTLIMGANNFYLYAQWNEPKGMVFIASKNQTFQMGGTEYNSEKPIHTVQLTKNMWLDKTEVTQESYIEIMSTNYTDYYTTPELWDDYLGKGNNYPAYSVNWYEALLYCNARTKLTSTDTVYTYTKIKGTIGSLSNKCELENLTINLDKKGFRLPTEAEWEFAAKGGNTIIYYSENQLMEIAWYLDNASYQIHPVSQKEANNFTLYDMLGNVQEWVCDWFETYENFTSTVIDPFSNPIPPPNSQGRVVRGGHYGESISKVSNSFRTNLSPETLNDYTGFRCCLPVME
jgi:uncharacterized repeat protein (TIGR02543 family)